MTPPDAAIAESSPAAPAPLPPLASLSSEARAQWRLTGEVPPATTDAPADSSSAPAGDQPASTDALPTQAASEPAKGKGVKARSAELDAEIAEMRDKLKARALLREELAKYDLPAKSDAAAASSPAPVVAPPVPDLRRPMLTEAEFFAAHPTLDYGQYGVYTAKYLLADDRQQQQSQQQQSQLQSKWAEGVTSVRAEHPDYDVLVPALEQIPDSPANSAISARIVKTGNARLLYHLASHLDEAKRLTGLDPADALVELGKLEASLGRPSPASPSVLKTVTDAPNPPPSITQRASVPASDIEAARAAGDFTRYKQLANARDIAAARGIR